MMMHRSRLRLAVLPILCAPLLLASAGCSSAGWGKADLKRPIAVTAPIQAGSPIRVESANGAVSVVAAEVAQVEIDATFYSDSQERLDQAKIVAERLADGTLSVRPVWPGGRLNNEGATITVRTPSANGVHIETSNGSVNISGLKGYAYMDTSNASIVVRGHDGEIFADTSNGAINIADATGKVTADTSNASVTLTLANDNPGPLDITTSNGSVTLAVGEAFTGVLKATTSNGRITSTAKGSANLPTSGGPTTLTQTFGDADQTSTVRTSNASVTVRQVG